MNTNVKALAALQNHANFFELYQVTTFTGYRKTKQGDNQEVSVDLLDRGPDHPSARYTVTATAKDGRSAGGNDSASIEEAIAIVHWYKLDAPPE